MSKKNTAIKEINTLLSDLVDTSAHDFARQKLLEIISEATGYAYAFLVEMEDDGVHMQVSSAYAPGSILQIAKKISGIDLVGYRYAINLDLVLKNPDIEIFDHISEFYADIPRNVGTIIGKTLGIKSIASLRQRTKDTYLGAVNFITTSTDVDYELLEYLCTNHLVYALRLMHEQAKRAEQEREYREGLEKRIEERTSSLEKALSASRAAEERIAELYLNMEQARTESETRAQETESLLTGLRTIAGAENVNEIFDGILRVLQDALSYENAFILIQEDEGRMIPLASTAPNFEKSIWEPGKFFNRILTGKALATFDIQMIPEWQKQPEDIQEQVCAALHIPIITQHSQAMLVCVHHRRGFFAKHHIRMAERFTSLAVQALQSAELYARLEEKKESLEVLVSERTAELVQSESRYRALFERTNDAVFFINLDGTYLDANQQAAEMLGYELDELLALRVEDVVASDEHSDAKEKIDALLAGKTHPVYRRTFIKKDGTKFPVEINIALAHDAEGNPTHIQDIVRDISERVRNAEAIASLAKFPDENPIAVLRVSSTGEILYANPASERILSVWECSPGDKLSNEILGVCFDASGVPEKKNFELEVGEYIYILSFTPIEGTDYINIYGRDITAEKESDRIKAEFIAGVSHELRTPLGPILGWSEILLDEDAGKINEEQREFLQTIYDSGKHLHRIVDDLLDITNLEAGKFKVLKEKIVITEPILKAVELVRPSAEKKSIGLDLEIDEDLPDVYGDLNRIQQVVMNLLSNAVKFTPNEGHVSLQATYSLWDDEVKIQVQDTGVGISEKNLPKVFSRFFRSESAVRASVQGTGLGLFITKEIVEAHGGDISVESTLGEGSLFKVILPVNNKIT